MDTITALSSAGPLLGYNNNIPYKGHVYHVQTEDSGSKRPHVITHLFADGGRIISTAKTSYADLLGAENLSEKVRALMRQQHKKMVISLRDGEFDHLLEPGSSEAPAQVEELELEDAVEDLPLPDADGDDDPEKDVQTQPAPRSDPRGESPGSYSFVGSRSSPPPPPAKDRRSPVATPPTGSPAQTPSPSDAPPAFEVTGRRRRPRTSPQGTRRSSYFGEGFDNERRFDELVLRFLARSS